MILSMAMIDMSWGFPCIGLYLFRHSASRLCLFPLIFFYFNFSFLEIMDMFDKKFLVRLFVFFKNSEKVCKNTHNVGDGEVHRFKSLPIMKRKAKRVLPTG